MIVNKFFDLLATLSFKELKRFIDLANSPYFNKNEEIKQFIELNVESILQNEPEKREDKYIFAIVYPQEAYKRDKLYRLRSDSLILLEKFIIYENIKPYEGINYLTLLYYYILKDLNEHFDEGHKIWVEKRLNTEAHNTDFYYEAFQEEQLLDFKRSKNKIRLEHNQLPVTESSHLDAFYYIWKLDKQLYLFDTQHSNPNIEALSERITETISKIKQNPHLSNALLVNIMILTLDMLRSKDGASYFEQLHTLLKENATKLPDLFLKNQYSRLTNFCIKQINLGKKEYYEKQFELYSYQLSIKLLYNERGKITLSDFKNILVVAIHLNKQEWAESFLEQHKDKLVSENPVMIYQYCQARILFQQKKYVETKNILNQIKLKDLLHAFDCRRMMIKCYYELGDSMMANTELDKFHVYINRKKKIAKKQIERNRCFANLLHKMMDYTEGNVHRKNKLLIELSKEKDIADRNWLRQKVNELR